MKYLYEADFSDGTTFVQPADDSSVLKPGERSSKYDFLEHCRGRTLVCMELAGDGHEVIAWHDAPSFSIDGEYYSVGEPLPEGFEWVEGDPHQGPYFRRVTQTFDDALKPLATEVKFCVGIEYVKGTRNFLAVT